MTPRSTGYIRELDGLRAVAVLLVLLFHAQLDLFAGGGIGVDVFFVISGYIITIKLLEAHEAEGIRLVAFWQNRFARLMPALLVTGLGVLVIAPAIFAGGSLDRIFSATISSLIYVSNFFFLSESGYFDADSIEKPMLHTWSLSVEEQFYLFWPIFLMFVFSLRRAWWVPAFAILGVASIGFALWAGRVDPSIAFYMMPARIYQFCAGAIIAFTFAGFRGRSANLCFGLALAGLVLVAIMVQPRSDGVLLSHALPALLSAAAIAAIRCDLSSLLLGNRVAVLVGRISYSVYLVHWPVMVFYFNQDRLRLEGLAPVVLIGVSLVLGYLLYSFVEVPFRFRSTTPESRRRNVLWGGATAVTLTVGAAGLLGSSVENGPARTEVPRAAQVGPAPVLETRDRRSLLDEMRVAARYGECSFTIRGRYALEQGALDECIRPEEDRIDVLVLGSSISDATFVGLLDSLPASEFNVEKAGLAGCDPHLEPSEYGGDQRREWRQCVEFNQERLTLALDRGFDVLVLSGLWLRISDSDLVALAEHIRARGAEPVLVGPMPRFEEDARRLLFARSAQERAAADLWPLLDSRMPPINQKLGRLAEKHSVPYVNVLDFLCRPSHCGDFSDEGRMRYFDELHLTVAGSHEIGDALAHGVFEAVSRLPAPRRSGRGE